MNRLAGHVNVMELVEKTVHEVSNIFALERLIRLPRNPRVIISANPGTVSM